ncbi:hypothetical protein SAY86_004791 [Trapa natans]|uniref:DUF3511 domain protein n=1 Tax=Trapa natans TaxID=22666 RepID=A0AAN7MGP9_TRANT|nr:hypothetical protein SAY86_004791 [Trapa natans]
MESWPSSLYNPHGDAVPAKDRNFVTVNNNEGVVWSPKSMFVSRSRDRPLGLDLVELPTKQRAVKKGSGTWWSNPEMKRRRRVTKYKMYSAEGKLKSTFKHGFRWIKRKCSEIAHRF